jgi:hypothetical protein
VFRVRVAELAPGEGLEERLGEQHHERLVADDHAGGLVVGEVGVEWKPSVEKKFIAFFRSRTAKLTKSFLAIGPSGEVSARLLPSAYADARNAADLIAGGAGRPPTLGQRAAPARRA